MQALRNAVLRAHSRSLTTQVTRSRVPQATFTSITDHITSDTFKGKNVADIEQWVEDFQKTETKWANTLEDKHYAISRGGLWEPAWSEFSHTTSEGAYHCSACGNALFHSSNKFVNENIPWPNFDAPVDPNSVTEKPDPSHGLSRTAVHCSGCDNKLGHVYREEPTATGARYTVASVTLTLRDD
eukprot:TRINITY_DN508_c0_g2_i4.p1 TRINITY_DN508_c0_g2~~TRINITY_DN508_c0_g2_i4.p1  ORF type:complete len:184 (+),score=26.79 TRINITY_DN508_c0_g2_i4:289-840(+)